MKIRLFKSLFFLLLCSILLSAFTADSYAAPSKKIPGWIKHGDFFKGSSNYIILQFRQGYATCLDVNTVSVLEYNPPEYKIQASMVTFDPSGRWCDESSRMWKYIWSDVLSERHMYIHESNGWFEIPRLTCKRSNYEEGCMVGGEIAWYISYNMDFYGDRNQTH
ncbi:hypothetical protein [Selenomonas ruminantium]|uniref:hypothetical protein n=1 Tax=Selenomonas ruminantium TaxID=971 RepID=UPI00047E138E|nr:hypothetical protein [Selenomonas ruminantium]